MSDEERLPTGPEPDAGGEPELAQNTDTTEQTEPGSDAPAPHRFRRLRRFFLRHLPLSALFLAILAAAAFTGLYLWMSSDSFEEFARQRLIATLEQATGCKVELAHFHWKVLRLEAEAEGLVLHGTEDAGEEPLARVERLNVQLSVLNFFSPRILVRSIDVLRPAVHAITYQDGTTNVPTPSGRRRSSGSSLDKFFDLRAGHGMLRDGKLHAENRATGFDFQNRYQPLDLAGDDLSLALVYLPAARGVAEQYRVEAGATDVTLTRSGVHTKYPPVHGYFQMSLELERNAARLRSLRVTARGHDKIERSMQVIGELHDFAHPRWQGHVGGELDMRLIDPITGYPNAPEGVLKLDLGLRGDGNGFAIDGPVHIENGAYVGTGVDARGLLLDARFHADPKRMLIDNVVIHLKTGGTMEGVVDLAPWRAPPGPARPVGSTGNRNLAPPAPFLPDIPMSGRVDARFKGVRLDALLDMVSVPPFKRLGFDAQVNGTALAQWQNGDNNTVSVSTNLQLAPTGHASAGEVPTSGVIDATYTHRTGQVDLRRLELHLPQSDVDAHGAMGAYPMTSASQLVVDFRSRNMNEFDTVLRDLGLARAGRTGASALPVTIGGQAEFHGLWSGSLLTPKISGAVKGSDLQLELLPLQSASSASAAAAAKATPRYVHLDAVEGVASYSETRVAVDHAVVTSGKAHLSVSGSLDAATARVPVFDGNSMLHLKLGANAVEVGDVQPFLGLALPITGQITAQIQADGPLRAVNGSGFVELGNGLLYGEPVKKLRATGSITNQTVQLSSVSATVPGGTVTGTGSYDLRSHGFHGELHANNVDAGKIEWVRQQNWNATGKLSLSVRGQGTMQDPRLEAEATLNGLALGGEPLGNLHLTAHTANRTASYQLTSRLDGAEISASGQTSFDNGLMTEAQVGFTRFDIGTLLRLKHVQAFKVQSALAGKMNVAGPLKNPENMRGELRVATLDATVAGVHLRSEGGLHALLGNGHVHLDPLHVTGDNTDMRLAGNIELKGTRQLDFATSGSVNLKLASTLDPDLTASGISTFQVEAHGTMEKPVLAGRVDFDNGALALENMPNGLSQIQGTLLFNQNRLEVKKLTAMSGGGQLSIGGALNFQNGLYADLTATGKGVRIRYPQGISSLADAQLRLQGPRNNLLLAGEVLITRFIVSPEMDFAALAAQTSAANAPAPPNAPSNHLRLDVHIASSPQLSFQNAFAKLAGDVDLRVRGTLADPAVLGRISVTEGSATIAGTRYDLQRGEIAFTNPVRIEPIIDLNATAHVQDFDITLGLHGTREKLAVSYRSDPPLPEADVVALLALGRTENQQRINTQQQVQALSNPTTDALLGGALNATVSSRVQRLFGAGSVKVDPNYLGALGNSTSRIIVEEQLGRNLTLTYATNVNTTGQQLLQAEVAINRHVSLLVSRDESGVFSMVIKATRRYR